MKRRNFLKGAVTAAAVMAVPSVVRSCVEKESGKKGPVPGKPSREFRYGPDGKFRILQITDTHHIAGDPRSDRALENVRAMMKMEKPDFIIHTGDIMYATPAEVSTREILEPFSGSGIPWAIVLGNHDGQFDLSRSEVYELIRSLPGCINSPAPEGITGDSNDVFTLCGAKGTEMVFYLFDTGNYLTMAGRPGYEYIHHDQIGWYRAHSEAFRKEAGGTPVPSFAFMHIPVREYFDAVKAGTLTGHAEEDPCPSNYNSGFVLNALEMGDIKAIVSGHEHDCDFVSQLDGLYYIYGRYSGGDCEYNHLGLSGARIFEFTEGKEGFRTYVRYVDGSVHDDIELDW